MKMCLAGETCNYQGILCRLTEQIWRISKQRISIFTAHLSDTWTISPAIHLTHQTLHSHPSDTWSSWTISTAIHLTHEVHELSPQPSIWHIKLFKLHIHPYDTLNYLHSNPSDTSNYYLHSHPSDTLNSLHSQSSDSHQSIEIARCYQRQMPMNFLPTQTTPSTGFEFRFLHFFKRRVEWCQTSKLNSHETMGWIAIQKHDWIGTYKKSSTHGFKSDLGIDRSNCRHSLYHHLGRRHVFYQILWIF